MFRITVNKLIINFMILNANLSGVQVQLEQIIELLVEPNQVETF